MNFTIRLTTVISLLFLCFACSKDELSTINESEVRLNYDEEFLFSVGNASNVEWSSSDEFVGVIEQDGKFSAKHIGETDITAKVGQHIVTAKVIVDPYITDIIVPVLKFGVHSETIKSEETRAFISEDASQIRFYGQGSRESRVYYNLRRGVVDNSVMHFDYSQSIFNILLIFLGERYELLEVTPARLTYVNKEKTIGVNVTGSSSSGIRATWVPSSYTVPKS
ncbi:Ig-like domain-containing protein [Sphingobacterium sp. lm-10]|uniref:Ig-like domain-containing protein n=1 Tax=Sphingobacterium sp. lm-10 TaxID=2944904 RepID=UPI002021BEC1|nr:Ig-like domain-containing protein [Sphingobacterium sp. lm-10]MCL7987753.1 Ig-like domain-containing protein [Sphingobacterium sp. lm-10]